MSKEIAERLYPVNLTDPITSGYESAEVRWSLPWRLRQVQQEKAEEKRRAATAKAPRSERLVYSSISDTKPRDTASRIELYPVSARIIRDKVYTDYTPTPPDRTGTEIQGFSDKSRSRLRFAAANSREKIKSQFCMTYGDVWPINGPSLKDDLRKFLKRIRKATPDFSYIWIAEFQTRGAPHFHLFSNLDPTPENHDKLTHAWYEIAGYGQDKVLRVHAHETNFIPWDMGNAGYLCKYLDKEAQKTIPLGFASFGRFWGNSQDLKPTVQDEITADEMKLFSRAPKPWEYLVRNLCRYQEKINRKSTIRTTPQSRNLLTGAAIAVRLRDELFKMKGEKPMCEGCGKNTDQLWRVHVNGLGFELCEDCKEEDRHNADYIEKIDNV